MLGLIERAIALMEHSDPHQGLSPQFSGRSNRTLAHPHHVGPNPLLLHSLKTKRNGRDASLFRCGGSARRGDSPQCVSLAGAPEVGSPTALIHDQPRHASLAGKAAEARLLGMSFAHSVTETMSGSFRTLPTQPQQRIKVGASEGMTRSNGGTGLRSSATAGGSRPRQPPVLQPGSGSAGSGRVAPVAPIEEPDRLALGSATMQIGGGRAAALPALPRRLPRQLHALHARRHPAGPHRR